LGGFVVVLLSELLGGTFIFSLNKNKALKNSRLIIHLEGAFQGIF
jgi:hypothetical protein